MMIVTIISSFAAPYKRRRLRPRCEQRKRRMHRSDACTFCYQGFPAAQYSSRTPNSAASTHSLGRFTKRNTSSSIS